MIRVKYGYTEFDSRIRIDYKTTPCEETSPFSQDEAAPIWLLLYAQVKADKSKTLETDLKEAFLWFSAPE